MNLSVPALLMQAGQWPPAQALAVIAGTLVLEDATTVGTAMAVQSGHLANALALAALYAGIVLGDLGLYGLGRAAAGAPGLRRLLPPQRVGRSRDWLEAHVFRAVFVARFLPGARLPTYTACGFLRASVGRFALAAIGATLVWTTLLYGVSLHVGALLLDHMGTWQWAGMIGFIVVVFLAGRFTARVAAAGE